MAKNLLDDPERLREIVKCAILYSNGEKNKNIGKRLGINAASVGQNIRTAKAKGIIKINIYPSLEVAVAERICNTYGLKDVYVFSIAGEVRDILSELAATYLEEILDEDPTIKHIAIGPGRTMLNLAMAISERRRNELAVSPTTSESRVETYMASNVLTRFLAETWECSTIAFNPGMRREEQMDFSDIFIFQIEKPDMNGVTALALLSATGIQKQVLERAFDILSKENSPRGVGIINYQPIDDEGNYVDWDLAEYQTELKPTLLRLEIIREIAKNRRKKVICIATGEDRADAIRAGLRGKYFNILITDYNTARLL